MENAEKASKLLEKLFAVAVEKVETIIDEELKETHNSVAKEIESSFGSIVKKLGYTSSSCSCVTLVQSGGNFSTR